MMTIIEDSRQHAGKHMNIHSYLVSAGIRVFRQKLDVGDYMIPGGHTSVDTKYGLQEVYNNLVVQHARFRRECVRAKETGIDLVILVEEKGMKTVDDVKSWKNPRLDIYNRRNRRGISKQRKPPISSTRLWGIMQVMSELYNVTWVFCDPCQTGKEVERILCEAALEEMTSSAHVKTEQSKAKDCL